MTSKKSSISDEKVAEEKLEKRTDVKNVVHVSELMIRVLCVRYARDGFTSGG